MSLQEKLQQVLAGFDATTYALGAAKPEEVVNFNFVYNGSIKIESVMAGCSCTNLRVESLEDGTQVISGTYRAPNRDSMERMHSSYIIDANEMMWEIKGQWATATDPRLGTVPASSIKGRKAPMLSQSIEVSFVDGEDRETIDENLVRRINGNKLKTNIAIQGIGDLS